MDPIVCNSCGARFSVDSLTQDDIQSLDDQHSYEELSDELRMLRRVQEYYRRHPDAEGRIKPHVDRLLHSDDPGVREQFLAGVPFNEIELPPVQLPKTWLAGEEDLEVVEYLQCHSFSLGPRLEFVSDDVERLRESVGKVSCSQCPTGQLRVPAEDWYEFNARETITWYWPDWHSFDDDGTLHIKASGWHTRTHWTGRQDIDPANPDYEFWCWLVDQEEYHRLVEEKELQTIREDWSRRTKDGS